MLPKMRLVFVITISILPSFLKNWLYRLFLRARIGRGAKIGFGAFICADVISIGSDSKIDRFSRVRAKNFEVLDRFRLGPYANVFLHSFYAGCRTTIASRAQIVGDVGSKESTFTMGMHSWVFQDCYIEVSRRVQLGRNVGVGGRTLIFTHGYWLSRLKGWPVSYGAVTIKDDVWIPWSCFIMPGVTIHEGSIVGAQSIVIKDVAPFNVVAGVPAKVVKDKSYVDVDTSSQLDMMKRIVQCYYESIDNEDHKHEVRIHPRIPSGNELSGNELHIIFGNGDPIWFEEYRVYDVLSEKSSVSKLLREQDLIFFEELRKDGIRFYPVDELSKSENLLNSIT